MAGKQRASKKYSPQYENRLTITPFTLRFLVFALIGLGTLLGTIWNPATQALADAGKHVIGEGDTLAKLAAEHDTTVAAIVQQNNLKNPDFIFPGQVIEIGQVETPKPAATTYVRPTKHIVAPGDTMWELAEKYGISTEVMASHNDYVDGDILAVDRELVVPPLDAEPVPVSARGGSRDAVAEAEAEAEAVAEAVAEVEPEPEVDPLGRIWVPFRSQLDGSRSAGSNCGPSSLGMAMSYFGEWWTTAGIRNSINEFQGIWDPDIGSSWEAMAYAARERGFETFGLYNADNTYHQWSIDEMVEQTQAGRPVMLIVRYWDLPGHAGAAWWGDHYIVFVGLTPDGDVVYHDAAFPSENQGAYLTMTPGQLERAWTNTATGLIYTAMAIDFSP